MLTTLRRRNKWVVLLLCVFLGRWGVHRFYTGKIGTGLAFLALSACDWESLAPWILWAFDILLILTDRFRDGNGLLLEGARAPDAPICYP